MKLNRWDPLRDMLNFQEKIAQLLDVHARHRAVSPCISWNPAVDILETPDAYLFRMELPGVGKANIDVELAGARLTISGERHLESEPYIFAYHNIERVYGAFARSFQLPGTVDATRAEARYIDGVLELILPKSEDVSDRCIHVSCRG
jgi:HSP20 family protein